MRDLQEILVVHSMDNYVAGITISNFFKWTGFSYYVHVHNELDDRLNNGLVHSNNHFDMAIYVNDVAKRFYSKYHHLSLDSISVLYDESKFECTKINPHIHFLYNLYIRLNLLQIIYISNDVYKKEKEMILARKKIWHEALSEIEQYTKNIDPESSDPGLEHLDYALLYCKKEINLLCDLLQISREFSDWDLLLYVDNWNRKWEKKYDYDFYIAEHMISQIAIHSSEYKALAIIHERDCIRRCINPFCKSFYMYNIGLLYEKANKVLQAKSYFNDAYDFNQYNFEALFKIIVATLKEKEGISKYASDFFKIFQISFSTKRNFQRKIKMISPCELEYLARGIHFLIKSEIELNEKYDIGWLEGIIIYLEMIVEVVKNSENQILSTCLNDPMYIKYLKDDLSKQYNLDKTYIQRR